MTNEKAAIDFEAKNDPMRLIAATSLPVVVLVASSACVPCSFIKPEIRKLAWEFGDRMKMIEVDGEAARDFVATHRIEAYPTILSFRDARVEGRMEGFEGARELRDFVASLVGAPAEEAPHAANAAFREALARAEAAFDDSTRAAVDAKLARFFDGAIPRQEALRAANDAEVARGRLSKSEAAASFRCEIEALYLPVKREKERLASVQAEALSIYELRADEAVADFAAAIAR